MSASIVGEVKFLGISLLLGVIILVIYDVLRIFRRVFPHSNVWIGIEDFFYWIAVSFFIFSILFRVNNGSVRWFSVIGIFLGMVLYNITLSPFLVKYISFVLKKVRSYVEKVLRFLFRPLKKMKKGLNRQWKNVRIELKKKRPSRKECKNVKKSKHTKNRRKQKEKTKKG